MDVDYLTVYSSPTPMSQIITRSCIAMLLTPDMAGMRRMSILAYNSEGLKIKIGCDCMRATMVSKIIGLPPHEAQAKAGMGTVSEQRSW